MYQVCGAALALFVLSFFLSGCGNAAVSLTTPGPPQSPDFGVQMTASVPATRTPKSASQRTKSPNRPRSATPSPSGVTPTLTSSPLQGASPSVSPSPSRAATFTPSPTSPNDATPTLFPMLIEAMRQGDYPGSEIVIDEELDAGDNYRRYYVYYLSQGLKIYALLTVPDDEMPAEGWPGIVFNHGYIPPQEYQSTERYIDYVDWLARSNYVVFRIDYRGHGHSEGDPQGAYGDPGYEVDVLNAVASLKRFWQVNPEKIGMWGHSMGGYLTLRNMVISQDVKAGVIWAGVVADYTDLLYHWPHGPSLPPANSRKWMEAWPAQFGTPEQNPDFWASISANTYLADLSGPLQLHYGTQDEDVPPQFSEKLAEQVGAAGGEVEIYSYLGDNHNISNSFNLAMERTIAFFDRYLK